MDNSGFRMIKSAAKVGRSDILILWVGAAQEVRTSGRPGKPDQELQNWLTRASQMLKNSPFPTFSQRGKGPSAVQTPTLASFSLRYVLHLNFKRAAAHMIMGGRLLYWGGGGSGTLPIAV